MAGVGATLVADDQIVVFSEDVDELAFGLVTPLQTDDSGTGHCWGSSWEGRTRRRGPEATARRQTQDLSVKPRKNRSSDWRSGLAWTQFGKLCSGRQGIFIVSPPVYPPAGGRQHQGPP